MPTAIPPKEDWFPPPGIFAVEIKVPSVIDLLNVGAHYAISSLFQDHSERERIYSYIVGSEIYEKYGVGKQKLIIEKALVESQITFEKESINFVVLSFGDYNLSVGVRKHTEDHYFSIIHEEIKDSFMHNNVPEVINLINRYFSESSYSLWDLFKNEQGKAMTHIFEGTLNYIELNFRQIYDQYYPLMQIRKKTKMPLPKALAMTVEFILNRDILEIFEEEMIIIAPCDRSRYIAKEKGVFKAYIEDLFASWGLDKHGQSTVAANVSVYEMILNATFAQMFGSLGPDLDKLCLSQHQIVEFCEKHSTRLRQEGYATFFLFKEGNQFCVAGVCVYAAGLNVRVLRLEDDCVWHGEYRHRLVVPQLTV